MRRTLPRTVLFPLAALALSPSGCGDDDMPAPPPMNDAGRGGDDAGPAPGDAGPAVDDSGPDMLDAGPATSDAGPGGEPPVITRVEWAPVGACTRGTRGDMSVTVTVTDADTPAAMLSFTGAVSGCTGPLDAASTTISCPEVAPYAGMITVTDPEAHMDTAMFTVGVCESGGIDL